MKKFSFALDRVLEWRRAQARREEMKLERLYAELSALDAKQASLREQREQAETQLRSHSGQTIYGEDLRALSAFQNWAAAEHGRIAQARARCGQQIAAQAQILTLLRRNVKLLEKLKDQRMTAWLREEERETGQQAEESHLAKWNREHV